MSLDEAYLEKAMQDARRFQGCWDTGTSGTLAAHTFRLIKDREATMATISRLEQENAALRAAVEERLQAASGGCCSGGKCHPKPPAVEIPADYVEANRRFEMIEAVPQKPAEFKVEPIGQTLTPEQLDAVWSATRERQQEMHRRIRGEALVHELTDDQEPAGLVPVPLTEEPAPEFRLIGIAGRAGSGKNAVAAMVPGAVVVQLADPLYAALSAMLGLPEVLLRSRQFKEKQIDGIGKSARQMLQTLGTEWGRDTVCRDIWLRMLERRIDTLRAAGVAVVAVADVRFDNEAEMVRGYPGAGEVWHVSRPAADDACDSHVSESGVGFAHGLDSRIDNSGTLEDLRRRVLELFSTASATV